MGGPRWLLGAVAYLAAAIGVCGCGQQAAVVHQPLRGRRLTIVVSVPFDGPSSVGARAVVGGATLALDAARHRVGRYRIRMWVVNDATLASRGWDPGQTSQNARRAISDPSTIGYVGDLNSGASAVSIPLLNRAGIPQVSPSSTAVGLTRGGPEASPGEPEKYYPTQRRTFVRVVPTDADQAAVQVALQRQAGCRRVAALDDGEVDGRDGALSFAAAAKAAGVDVVDTYQFEPGAASYRSLAASIAQTGADCILISALPQNHAALVTEQVAAALPRAQIFGWSGLADPAYTDPGAHGVPLALDDRMLLTVPTLAVTDDPPAGRRFLAQYAGRYGAPPPDAIFGYEAMSLMLDAISRATDGGRREAVRSNVLAALFNTRDRHSVLGTYSITHTGDTTLERYGVYRVSGGRLVFWKAMSG